MIHAFLTKQLHTKAAQAVKRAAKEVVVLKDDIELEGPQLDEIIKQWKSDSQKKESSWVFVSEFLDNHAQATNAETPTQKTRILIPIPIPPVRFENVSTMNTYIYI